jgi:hypothetical protein
MSALTVRRRVAVIRLLIQKGGDVNAKTSRGWMPLPGAANDAKGRTPREVAEYEKHEDVARLLSKLNAP